MPVGILRFKLPEENVEFDLAQKAGALSAALNEISEHLRKLYKYNNELSDDQRKLLVEIRESVREIINEYEAGS